MRRPQRHSLIEDCTLPWSFKADTYDYIHMRFLYGSIPNWDALFDEAYRACRPGGWIESHDSEPIFRSDDGSVHPDSAAGQWGRIFIEAGRQVGRTFEVIPEDLQIKAMLRLGMEEINVLDIKVCVWCVVGGYVVGTSWRAHHGGHTMATS
jgi:SAM-dependent methyltransferase